MVRLLKDKINFLLGCVAICIASFAQAAPLVVPPNTTNNGTVLYNGGTISAGGIFTNNGAASNDAVMNNSGTFINNAGGKFTNLSTGTFTNFATLTNSGTITNTGIMFNAGGGSFLNNAGGILDNAGTGGSFFNQFGTFTNNGTINNTKNFNILGTFVNNNIINNSLSMIVDVTSISFSNPGTINNLSGGTFGFNKGTLGGTIVNATGAQFSLSFSASAGNAAITNSNILNFNASSLGGSANITNTATGTLTFNNTSSAQNATITNNHFLIFNGSSLGGSANITNTATGTTTFSSTSSAQNATITNAGTVNIAGGSACSAGNAIIINNNALNFVGGTAGTSTLINNAALNFINSTLGGSANITNNATGTLSFNATSSAQNATIINNHNLIFNNSSLGGSANITNTATGTTTFSNTSSAQNAIITNNHNLNFFGSSLGGSANITNTATGTMAFDSTSSAQNAIITNAGIMNVSSSAGNAIITNNNALNFLSTGTAGTAQITNNNTGLLSFSGTSSAATAIINNDGALNFAGVTTGLTIGTLNGSGTTSGVGKALSVGSGYYTGTLGAMSSLTKIGPGTLILDGNNSAFAANVAVSAGYLNVGSTSSLTSAQLGSGAGNLTVASGASVGGYGTMSFNNATLDTGSKLIIGLAPLSSTSGSLNANTFNINSGVDLQLEAADPFGIDQTYVISDYGALSGVFSTITPVGITELININYGSPSDSRITVNVRSTSVITDVTSSPPLADVILDLSKIERTSLDDTDSNKRKPPLVLSHYKAMFGSSYGKYRQPRSIFKSLSNSGPIIMKKDDRRLWIMPYYTHSDISNLNTRETKINNEGLIFGYENKYDKSREHIGVVASLGLGENRSPSSIALDNKVNSKVLGIGAYYKKETDATEFNAIVNGLVSRHHSKRYGNPLPGALYTATSKYYSKDIGADLIGLWKYPVSDTFSIRPDIGISLDHRVRDSHSENGGGIYNQTYLKKRTNSVEPYAGVGVRKEWFIEEYRYRLTAIYEHGYECADNDTITRISTMFGPTDGFRIQTRGAGRNADYLTIHASALNYDSNFKLMAGYIGVSKKYLKSHTFLLKAEQRF